MVQKAYKVYGMPLLQVQFTQLIQKSVVLQVFIQNHIYIEQTPQQYYDTWSTWAPENRTAFTLLDGGNI